MDTTPGFACTLDAGGLRDRRQQFETLAASLLEDRIAPREATFVFSREARGTVEAFVRDESACCGFFGFQLENAEEGRLVLTVAVPAGGEPMLALLASTLTREGQPESS